MKLRPKSQRNAIETLRTRHNFASTNCIIQEPSKMKEEVRSAVDFFALCLQSRASLTREQIEMFKGSMEQAILEKFKNHWHPTKPLKGNAFRCINIDNVTNMVDPILVEAAETSKIKLGEIQVLFPEGLDLWIDPDDVSFRIGKGAIWPVYRKGLSSPETTVQNYINTSFNNCGSHPGKPFNKRHYDKENYQRVQWVNRECTISKANYDRYHWVKPSHRQTVFVH